MPKSSKRKLFLRGLRNEVIAKIIMRLFEESENANLVDDDMLNCILEKEQIYAYCKTSRTLAHDSVFRRLELLLLLLLLMHYGLTQMNASMVGRSDGISDEETHEIC